jgi:hypothetical protein
MEVMARNSTEQRMSLGKLHVISNFSEGVEIRITGIACGCELIYNPFSNTYTDFGWAKDSSWGFLEFCSCSVWIS